MAQSCRLAAATPPGALLAASLDVRPVAGGLAIAVTAHDPVAGAALALPTQCPAQADSLDGLLDTYATPGFSFAPGFGPARWFTSRTVFIRLAVLRRTRRLAVAVGPAAASVPPRHCAVRHPSIERCATGGSWRGVLTFTALP
jgi:hypothetical protein